MKPNVTVQQYETDSYSTGIWSVNIGKRAASILLRININLYSDIEKTKVTFFLKIYFL